MRQMEKQNAMLKSSVVDNNTLLDKIKASARSQSELLDEVCRAPTFIISISLSSSLSKYSSLPYKYVYQSRYRRQLANVNIIIF
tara:strand:+ start:120 stop:371 length:252 start_codon:yes stop_codon:yes gene_type:complete